MGNYSFNQDDNTLSIKLNGRMDTVESMEIEVEFINAIKDSIVSSKIRDEVRVELDMMEVEYISSTFMRICLNGAKMLRHNHFVIKNSNEMIRQTLQISGFDAMLNIL